MSPSLDFEETRRLLERGTLSLDLDLSPEQIDQFLTYLELLLKWNRRINLTAVRTPREIISRHFLDSLLLLPHLPETGRLLDLGSGAGFPGLPLKIARPGLALDLAEATAKKASFLKEAIRQLGLSDTNVFSVFFGKDPFPFEPIGPWDVFLSRGVNLEVVLRALAPYWRPASRLFLMKGLEWREEIENARPYMIKLDLTVKEAKPTRNPLSQNEWVLVILAGNQKTEQGKG